MSAMRQIVSFKMIRRLNRLCVRTGWKLFVPSAVMAACLLALCAVLNTAVKYALDWFLLPYAQADGVSELLSVLYRHAGTAAACLLTAADAALFTCGMQVQILKRYMKESAGYADVFYGFVHWTRPVWYAVLRALLSLIPAAAAAYAALRFPVWPVYAAGIAVCLMWQCALFMLFGFSYANMFDGRFPAAKSMARSVKQLRGSRLRFFAFAVSRALVWLVLFGVCAGSAVLLWRGVYTAPYQWVLPAACAGSAVSLFALWLNVQLSVVSAYAALVRGAGQKNNA